MEYGLMGKPIEAEFESLFLDPNNPRLGQEAPGYKDMTILFSKDRQEELEERLTSMYDHVSNLESSILTQGWVPIDPIIVWEHPEDGNKYVVLEGNTRITTLRRIHKEFPKKKEVYEKKLAKKGVSQDILAEVKEEYERYTHAVKSTQKISVIPLIARDEAELKQNLPKVLGVRHVSHAQQWKPYATARYIDRLYTQLFTEKYGQKKLSFDKDLLKQAGDLVSYKETKTRRSIQSARAFEHFKERFEDKLPPDEEFLDEDHYYFELICQNRFVKDQLGLSIDSLSLSDEGEQALFKWAFSKPRKKGDENKNIFYKAENVGLWAKIKRYDDANTTTFAANFNVESPEEAEPMRRVEAEYLHSQAQTSPIDTINRLIAALDNMKGSTMTGQSAHVVPMLDQLISIAKKYLKMLSAVSS